MPALYYPFKDLFEDALFYVPADVEGQLKLDLGTFQEDRYFILSVDPGVLPGSLRLRLCNPYNYTKNAKCILKSPQIAMAWAQLRNIIDESLKHAPAYFPGTPIGSVINSILEQTGLRLAGWREFSPPYPQMPGPLYLPSTGQTYPNTMALWDRGLEIPVDFQRPSDYCIQQSGFRTWILCDMSVPGIEYVYRLDAVGAFDRWYAGPMEGRTLGQFIPNTFAESLINNEQVGTVGPKTCQHENKYQVPSGIGGGASSFWYCPNCKKEVK
jgi:hypothetical protein